MGYNKADFLAGVAAGRAMKSWPAMFQTSAQRQPRHIYQSDNGAWYYNPEVVLWSPIGTAGGNVFRVMASNADTLVYAIANSNQASGEFDYTLYFLTLIGPNNNNMSYWVGNTQAGYRPAGTYSTVYDGITIYFYYSARFDGPDPKILDVTSPYVRIVSTLDEACDNYLYGAPYVGS
jgi:hypothetical protein